MSKIKFDDSRIIYCQLGWDNETNKKKAYFGGAWGNLDKNEANAMAYKTGNGLVVIDIDTLNLDEIDKTIAKELNKLGKPTVTTKRGGHWYFEHENSAEFVNDSAYSALVDIRSDGGIIFSQYLGKDSNISYKKTAKVYKKIPKKLLNRLRELMKVKTKRKQTRDQWSQVPKGEIHSATLSYAGKDFHSGFSLDEVMFRGIEYVEKFLGGTPREMKLMSTRIKDAYDYHLNNKLDNTKQVVSREVVKDNDIGVYLHNNEYLVHNKLKNKLYSGLTKDTAKLHFTKSESTLFSESLKIVDAVVHKVDYFNPTSIEYKNDTLISVINPSDEWKIESTFDKKVIKDYQKIMDNKLDDLVKLIIYTMRFEEEKLNKLLLTGKSNKGKTALMKLLNFVIMSAKDFVNVVANGAKWSKTESARLMKVGLLLADDIAGDLPLEIKNISDTISIDIMHIGATPHPCKMLVMTSTHDSVVSTVNDELKNRLLHINIGGDYVFNDSKLRAENPQYYQAQTELYVKQLVVKALKLKVKPKALQKLQQKYALPEHNERDEIIQDINKQIKQKLNLYCKNLSQKEIFTDKDGSLYVASRTKIKDIIREIVRDSFQGHRIDITKEVTNLTNKYISDKRFSVRIKSKVKKGYKILKI